MPFLFLRGDITKLDCDAIVNAANNSLLGGGGVDGAIHRAAGPELLAECRTLGGCKTGEAKLTKGYRLPAKYIIHTVGPVWSGGSHGEEALLASCYRRSLEIAAEHGFESIAFPMISAGVYGYPFGQAKAVAVRTVTEFLQNHDMLVYLVFFGDVPKPEDAGLTQYLSRYEAPRDVQRKSLKKERGGFAGLFGNAIGSAAKQAECMPMCMSEEVCDNAAVPDDLNQALRTVDESFTEMLLRKIDEKGMTDAECYKKANIDRKLFSKIRSDLHYRPKKVTVLAFAIALELSLEETNEMLRKAGFALSHSSRFDIIVEYFIANGRYNVFEINDALFAYDQLLIGA